ncbi:MAG: preprotein translocase subunit SecE [Dehalococcoidia bacterium]
MRRQQERTKTTKPARAQALRPALAGGGAGGGGIRSRGSMLRPNWFKDIFSELRKVQWPTREEAWHLTWVVVLVSLAVGVALGGLDSAFGWFLEHTLLR